ncbi:MAG: hypothetical protein ACLUD2_14430, partial [Clostridium sp.]
KVKGTKVSTLQHLSLDGNHQNTGFQNGVLPVMAASLLHNGTTVLGAMSPKYRMFSVCWGF